MHLLLIFLYTSLVAGQPVEHFTATVFSDSYVPSTIPVIRGLRLQPSNATAKANTRINRG